MESYFPYIAEFRRRWRIDLWRLVYFNAVGFIRPCCAGVAAGGNIETIICLTSTRRELTMAGDLKSRASAEAGAAKSKSATTAQFPTIAGYHITGRLGEGGM